MIEKISSNNVSFGRRKINAQTHTRNGFVRGFIAASAAAAGIYCLSKKENTANGNVKKLLTVLKSIPYLILGFLLGVYDSLRKQNNETVSADKPLKDETSKQFKEDTADTIIIIEPEAEEEPVQNIIIPVTEDASEEEIIEPVIVSLPNANDASEADEIIDAPVVIIDEAEEKTDDEITDTDIIKEDETDKKEDAQEASEGSFNDIRPTVFDSFLIEKLGPKQPKAEEEDDILIFDVPKTKKEYTPEEINEMIFESLSDVPPVEFKKQTPEDGKIAQRKYIQYIKQKYNLKRY